MGFGEVPGLLSGLEQFVALIQKWNPAINLISRDSLAAVWSRHIGDSLQVFSVAPIDPKLWLDLGSGGGFPGAVVAMAARAQGLKTRFVLVEADQRKAAFLRTVSRETGAAFEVVADRIEGLAPQNADVVSARALASLSDLCGYAVRHLALGGTAIFPKGRGADHEVEEARKTWRFDLAREPSLTDPDAKILLLKGLRRG